MTYIPKLTDNLSLSFERLKTIDNIIESFELRLEAEDAYEKALLRTAQKFGTCNTNLPIFGTTASELSKGHAQRSYQVSNYKEQLKLDLTLLKEKSKGVFLEVDGRSKKFKKIQKDFKINLEKVEKAKDVATQSRKDLDQKIILNQIGKLNQDISEEARKKLFQAGTKLAAEQKDIQVVYFSSVSQFSDAIKLFNSGLQSLNTELHNVSQKMSVQFFDFLKKYAIHQINVFRNLQYDMNNWIKKVEIAEQLPVQPITIDPLPQFSDNKDPDGWEQIRLYLVTETLEDYVQDQNCKEEIQNRLLKAVQSESLKQFLVDMEKNFNQWKPSILRAIEGYRLKNKFKFQQEEFSNLSQIFVNVSELSYRHRDLDFMQKVLLFSMTYYKMCKNEKRFVIEEIKVNKFFSELQFWRFFCFFSLRSIIANFKKKEIKDISQSALHQKNSVYSTLLTIATNMINFGIEKHFTKNFVAKAAKTFPLTEFQTTQIIRFIDNQSVEKKSVPSLKR